MTKVLKLTCISDDRMYAGILDSGTYIRRIVDELRHIVVFDVLVQLGPRDNLATTIRIARNAGK
jgi:hypothetical protein